LKTASIAQMKFIRTLTILTASLLFNLAPASAQESNPEFDNNPAVKVVKEYLKCMLEQDWTGSSKLVEPKSLEDLRDDYVKRVKNTASLDEEKMVVEKFKVSRLEDIEKQSGSEFYVAYHRLLKERTPVEPAVLKKVRDSMKLRILSVAMETDKLCHILVRTKHNNDRVNVESIEVLSMVKLGDKWVVGLNEQTPKITPIQASAEPVKETPKPAAAKPEPTKPATPKKK
jgi:hypothetical protein